MVTEALINEKNAYTSLEDDQDEVILDGEDNQAKFLDTSIPIEEENVYPMKTIKVDKGFYTAYELKRKHDKKPSLVILDSDFQRKGVWSPKQKRELIESVLMGLPLPIFYFNEDKKGRLIVVDGRQRLTALFEFLAGDFHLGNLKILDQFDKLYFNDLDPILQSKIEDYQIMAHVIQPPTPDRIKFDIFDRVNRAGTQLNKQEIRNALYQGNATKLLEELCDTTEFKDATEKTFLTDKRMKDRYLILRFISFYLYFNKKIMVKDENSQYTTYQYSGDIDELLGLTMDYLNSLDEKGIEEIKHITLKSLNQILYYMPNNAFRLVDMSEDGKLKRYPININIFENIMFAMTLLPYQDKSIKDIVHKKFSEMKSSVEFRGLITNHRDSDIKVSARYNMIQKIVRDINDSED